jgi:ATP-dependent Clp protease ATP-binding subunit ClpA
MAGEIATGAHRYIRTICNPDKAIDLMDEACAIAQAAGDKTLQRTHVYRALSGMTNIPMHFFAENEEERYANLAKTLSRRVLEQDEAVDYVAAALKRARAGLKDPETPVGNFLFLGPTGVGKTELAKALAEILFGSADEFFVRFDMSEYPDVTAMSRFLGGNPNYVGYEEGGLLVKTLRSKPFGVYLYDEGEKAHRDIYNALLAPFSNGMVTDGRGVKASMRDAINIITCNLGADEVRAEALKRKIDSTQAPEEWQAMARPIFMAAAQGFFRQEFRNRMDAIVPFGTLSPKAIEKLVRRQLQATEGQLRDRHELELEIAPIFLQAAAKKGFDPQFGARPLKRAWNEIVGTPMAAFILEQGPRARAAAKKIIMEVDAPDAPAAVTLAAPVDDGGAEIVSLASISQGRRRQTYDVNTVRPRFRYA